jgi:hypothetical protein
LGLEYLEDQLDQMLRVDQKGLKHLEDLWGQLGHLKDL